MQTSFREKELLSQVANPRRHADGRVLREQHLPEDVDMLAFPD